MFDSVKMLMLIFLVTLAFAIMWTVFWLKAHKNAKSF